MYTLVDGQNRYICKDKYIMNGSSHETFGITTDYNKAITWESEEKAENVRKNCLKPNMKQKFHVSKLKQSEKLNNISDEIPEKSIMETTEQNTKIDTDTYTTDMYMNDLSMIMESITILDTVLKESHNKLNILHHALGVIDREITDIHHWIEFNSFNACEGYKAFALLQGKLKTRREIKNGIEVFTAALNIEDTMQGIKNKKYQPRELKELFGG